MLERRYHLQLGCYSASTTPCIGGYTPLPDRVELPDVGKSATALGSGTSSTSSHPPQREPTYLMTSGSGSSFVELPIRR
jgi:hypothetical protein